MANVTYTFCTANDIADILSTSGITLRADDAPPDTYGNAIAKAGNQIVKYLNRRYDPANLLLSDLVKDWAAVIAAYFLCIRRGNQPPPGIAIAYEETINDLKEVQKGVNEIPGIPSRKAYVPVFSKMRETQRPYPRAVVETSQGSTATGQAENYHQHADPWDSYGWNSSGFLDNSL